MKIFPAIDIKDGKAVRLLQGDFEKVTVYSDEPSEVARNFKEDGAKYLHLVDLDGAKDGGGANFELIKRITKESGMFVQVGGGIRDEERISRYLEAGAKRVILGTVAVTDFEFLVSMVKKHGNKIAVGVDVKNEFVAINGWTKVTEVKGMDFCEKLADAGVETVIYTDISKDGALKGTNLEAYSKLSAIHGLNIIASGGVSFEHEISRLKNLGVYGAILGKALYSGMLDLKRAIELGG